MSEHKRMCLGEKESRLYILAALKMHGQQSFRQISLITGMHFNTVRKYVKRLIDEGEIVRVQKDEYEYALPEEGENSA